MAKLPCNISSSADRKPFFIAPEISPCSEKVSQKHKA